MRITVVVVAGLAVVATPAGAADVRGRPWPGGVISYAVASNALAPAVRTAARAWNRSGVRVVLREVPRGSADVIVTSLPSRPCFGAIGRATLGYVPGFGGRMWLQATCGEGVRVMAAAHEFGHILGLGHEDRRCALMNSSHVARCGPQPLAWEWYCSPPRNDDRRGALRLYGGRFRSASVSFCVSPQLPRPLSRLRDEADPVGSLARVVLTFRNPVRRLDRVTVQRRRGRSCPNTPLSQQIGVQQRPGAAPRLGNLVTEYVATDRRGVAERIEDLAVVGEGDWCYAVFVFDRRGRWRLAGERRVTRGVEAPLAARVGLGAAPLPAGGVQVTWTTPVTPLVAVEVLRTLGPCPADAATMPVLASGPTAAGPAAVGDPDPTPGPRCYAVRFRPAGADVAPRIAVAAPVTI